MPTSQTPSPTSMLSSDGCSPVLSACFDVVPSRSPVADADQLAPININQQNNKITQLSQFNKLRANNIYKTVDPHSYIASSYPSHVEGEYLLKVCPPPPPLCHQAALTTANMQTNTFNSNTLAIKSPTQLHNICDTIPLTCSSLSCSSCATLVPSSVLMSCACASPSTVAGVHSCRTLSPSKSITNQLQLLHTADMDDTHVQPVSHSLTTSCVMTPPLTTSPSSSNSTLSVSTVSSPSSIISSTFNNTVCAHVLSSSSESSCCSASIVVDEAAGARLSSHCSTPAEQQPTAAAALASNQHSNNTIVASTHNAILSSRSLIPLPCTFPQGRYHPLKTIQNSLFGQVQLAYDNKRKTHVAIKVSSTSLINQVDSNQHVNTPYSCSSSSSVVCTDAAPGWPSSSSSIVTPSLVSASNRHTPNTARSLHGVCVLEDVRREARILRKLLCNRDDRGEVVIRINADTCGLNDLSGGAGFALELANGQSHIARFYEEVEADSFHYLISEYVAGGDLFSVLTTKPQHRVSESVARNWLHQTCVAVQYLHAQSIAHLDLSLENICLTPTHQIRLIDFGLASLNPIEAANPLNAKYLHPNPAHPSCTTLPVNQTLFASKHIRLLSSQDLIPTPTSCDCSACTSKRSDLIRNDPSLLDTKTFRFLCRPCCTQVHKPGKLGYMSPELYKNQVWDAFKHDMYALGVILYSILTGRPPYSKPDESDIWFSVVYSGQWLSPQVRTQEPARIYTNLSANALNLIDTLIKPARFRPSIDQVLKHPFFDEHHPGNYISVQAAQLQHINAQQSTYNTQKGALTRGRT